MTTQATARAAIYARFSSDNQDETSLDSQIAECRRYAAANGIEIQDDLIFTDAAVSGRTTARDGYQEMIASAQQKPARFTVLLIWKFRICPSKHTLN